MRLEHSFRPTNKSGHGGNKAYEGHAVGFPTTRVQEGRKNFMSGSVRCKIDQRNEDSEESEYMDEEQDGFDLRKPAAEIRIDKD